LGNTPHKVLTKPVRIFEYAFDGTGNPRGRDNMVRLEVVEDGVLNAIAFWFDLHLDEHTVITTGAPSLYAFCWRPLKSLLAYAM
jgi:type III protein arginine methyltransferase